MNKINNFRRLHVDLRYFIRIAQTVSMRFLILEKFQHIQASKRSGMTQMRTTHNKYSTWNKHLELLEGNQSFSSYTTPLRSRTPKSRRVRSDILLQNGSRHRKQIVSLTTCTCINALCRFRSFWVVVMSVTCEWCSGSVVVIHLCRPSCFHCKLQYLPICVNSHEFPVCGGSLPNTACTSSVPEFFWRLHKDF